MCVVPIEESFGTGAGGKKDDNGKLAWHLLIPKLLHGIIQILMYGCSKYAAQSWQHVPGGKERYWSALMRHLSAMQDDNGNIDLNKKDVESGLYHLWHMQCNAYFLEYFRQQEK